VNYPEPGVATRPVQFQVIKDAKIVPLEEGGA
jgi:hypothetical protein